MSRTKASFSHLQLSVFKGKASFSPLKLSVFEGCLARNAFLRDRRCMKCCTKHAARGGSRYNRPGTVTGQITSNKVSWLLFRCVGLSRPFQQASHQYNSCRNQADLFSNFRGVSTCFDHHLDPTFALITRPVCVSVCVCARVFLICPLRAQLKVETERPKLRKVPKSAVGRFAK